MKIILLKPCEINELQMQARAMQFVYDRISGTLRIIYFEEKLAPNGTVSSHAEPSLDIRDEPEVKDPSGNVVRKASTEFSELAGLIEKDIMPFLEDKLEQFFKKGGKTLES